MGAILLRGGGHTINSIHNNKYNTKYIDIITFENILKAWNKFKKGKSNKSDVNDFALKLTDNLLDLYYDLKNKIYTHSEYQEFNILETKKRIIHKASVRDRVVHHLLYDTLYDYFDKKFMHDSYSCRKNKGVHKAIQRYEHFAIKVSKNYTKQVWILKFDIQKCFASINHNILKSILEKHIQDLDILNLLFKIIDSHTCLSKYDSKENMNQKSGIPLGNLTSQLFVNIYLHELDFYCKHTLKIKYYIRYADDVVIFLENENKAKEIIDNISLFCKDNLKLNIHKVEVKTIYSGVDFLGWVHFPKYRVLRKVTRVKMLRNISEDNTKSYEGLLKWGSGYKLNIFLSNKLQ